MKLLKIKSYLIGFIVVMISIFSFNNNAKAYNFAYNGIYFDSDEILDRIKDKYSNIDFENTYRYHIAFLRDNSLYFIFTDRINAYDLNTQTYLLYEENFYPYSNDYAAHLGYSSAGWGFWTRRLFYYYRYDFNNNTEEINTTNNAYNELLFASKSEKLDSETWEQFLDRKILYSNINFTLTEAMSNENYYRPYDKEKNASEMIITHNYEDEHNRYSITIKLTQTLESTLNYEYSYDNETWHTLSAFSSSSNSFNLNHYFNIPIYFRIRKLNTNEIIWSTLYEEDFSKVDKHIIVSEKAGVDDGNEYIKTSFDFSEYFKYKNSGSYELKTFFDDNEIELFDDVWSTTIYKQGFDNFGNFKTNIKIKIDNKVVEELNYTLNEEDKEFDEVYDDILNDNLNQDLSNGDYSTVEGMIESIKSFITAISSFVSSFFGLIIGFFNALNIWIRSFIISIFVVIVICKLIKAVRK